MAVCTHPDKKIKPAIFFKTKPIIDPSISFIGDELEPSYFSVGKLPLYFNMKAPKPNSKKTVKPSVITKFDNLGEYLEVKWPSETYSQMDFRQLFDRIGDKLVSLDHVGISFNPRQLPKSRYQSMKQIVAKSCNLINYPGKEWSFIIFKTDPKFEFTYDFPFPYPEIHLDIQTSLSPKETISMFPPPYGYYDPDPINGDYCCSIYVYTGWANTSLRIDLRFSVPNFNHTDWLLKLGSRVKQN